MKRIQQGFTLIELMIVVAIIGILAAVALPAYQDYIARAQVAEAMELLSAFKSPVSTFRAEKGAFPSSLGASASIEGTTSGKYVATITAISGQKTAAGPFIIQATFRATGVNSQLVAGGVGTTFAMSTTDGQDWLCGILASGTTTNTTTPAKLLPTACK